MFRLMQMEIRKLFDIKVFFILSLLIGIICSGILLTSLPHQKELIIAKAQNIRTSSTVLAVSPLTGENNLHLFIENLNIPDDPALCKNKYFCTKEDVENQFNLEKERQYTKINALFSYDFETYNLIEYTQAFDEKNEEFKLFKTNNSWEILSSEACKGNVICMSKGQYQLEPKLLTKYNYEKHVYPAEYKQASDYVLLSLVSMFIIIVPMIGITISYLAYSKEKKEGSYKITWTLPYSKTKILMSKVFSIFLISCFVFGLSITVIYLITGIVSGFQSSERLISIRLDLINLIKPDTTEMWIMMTQKQLNVILFLIQLVSLFMSILVSYILSIIFQNKKMVFLISMILILILPIGSIYLFKTKLNGFQNVLLLLYENYAMMLPYHLPANILETHSGIGFPVYSNWVTLLPIDYSKLDQWGMNLALGSIVTVITSILILLSAYIIMKREDIK